MQSSLVPTQKGFRSPIWLFLVPVGYLFLGSLGIYRPQGVAATSLIKHDKNTLKIITQPKLVLWVLDLNS